MEGNSMNSNLETKLVHQCTPLIVGRKVANLLIIENMHVASFKKLIKKTPLSYLVLRGTKRRTTIFLYNKSKLMSYVAEKEVSVFLLSRGYESLEIDELLSSFQIRYIAYRTGFQEFPHEMGLLLGYPLEDVEGFINNKGKNSLYTGYWKVYQHLPEKILLFSEYARARELLMKQIASGVALVDIINSNAMTNRMLTI